MDRDREMEARKAAETHHAAQDCCNEAKVGVGYAVPVREPSAREELARLSSDCEATAMDLDALSRALPMELPYRADRALRRLIRESVRARS